MRALTTAQGSRLVQTHSALWWMTLITIGVLPLTVGGCPGSSTPAGLGPVLDDLTGGTDDESPGDVGADPNGPGGDVAGEVVDGLRAEDVLAITPKAARLRVTLRALGDGHGPVEFIVVSAPAVGTLGPIRQTSATAAEVYYTPSSTFTGPAQFSYAIRVGDWQSDPATVHILVYPDVRFVVDPTAGAPGLTVRAQAYTVGGGPLPDGTYTWSFGDETRAGPVTTHADMRYTFRRPGPHRVRLTLTLLGFMIEAGCSQTGVSSDHAVVTVGAYIGGRIREATGRPVSGVQVVAAGIGAATTDTEGRYRVAVPYNWSGRLSPSHPDYTFEPPQRTFREVKLDIDNAGFVATSSHANMPPEAQAQSVTTDVNTPVAIELKATDPENDPLKYIIATLPAHAELTDEGTGHVVQAGELPYALAGAGRRVVYHPETNWSGDDEFAFYAADPTAAGDPAVVSVRVQPLANQPPLLENPCPLVSYIEVDSLESNPANQVSLVAIDPDAELGELVWSLAEPPQHGTATITGSPSSSGEAVIVAYEPAPGFAGQDALSVVVRDRFQAEHYCRWYLYVGGYTVSGVVRGHDGAPRSGVPLVFTGSGASFGINFVTLSGAAGAYSQRVPLHWCGMVATDADHRLDPPERFYPDVVAPITDADYLAFRNHYVAPSGSNQGPGTLAGPFATVQRGADAARPGDTVVLRAGTYDSGSGSATVPVLLIRSGAGGVAGHPVTIRAAAGESVVLDGRAGVTRELVQIQASYVDIEGLELTGARRTALVVMHDGSDTRHVNIRLCHAHRNDYESTWIGGAFRTLGPVQHVVFEDCLSHNNSIGFEFRENPTQTAATAQVPPVAGNVGFSADLPESEWDHWPGWTEYAARYCVFRRCVAFDNQLRDEHSDGFCGRYAIECIVEDNIAFRNTDDNYDLLGATRCVIRRNIGFDANPNQTVEGDGNGLKVGVRGGLDNVAYYNVLFDNPRAGIDMTRTERAEVYNNTSFNNRWFGFWLEAVRATAGGARVLNNICNGNTQGDLGALPASRIVELDYNVVSDANNHNWARPPGPNGFVGMTAGFTNPELTIDVNFPAGATIPQKLEYIRSQVHSKLRLKIGCLCVDSGVEIPGVTEGHLGNGPDRGGIESH